MYQRRRSTKKLLTQAGSSLSRRLFRLPSRINSPDFVETCVLSGSQHIESTAGWHTESFLSRIDQEMHWISRKDI